MWVEISYNRAFPWVYSDFLVIRSRRAPMSFDHLAPEQAARAAQIRQVLQDAFTTELDNLTEFLATKPDSQLLGQTEFEVRDRIHQIGAKAIETAINLRKK